MKSNTVYIKVPQSVQVLNKKIYVQDVAEIYSADSEIVKQIGNIVLFTLKGNKNEKKVFSVMKLIAIIQKEYPSLSVENVGEFDFVVEYKLPQPPNKLVECLKLIFVLVIVFIGSAFTIMTFNTDVSVGDVFKNIYYLFTGSKQKGGSILEIAYSIGIFIGIMGFFNHFKSIKQKEDPTPIHMEMRLYEEEMNKAIIKDADREGKTIK